MYIYIYIHNILEKYLDLSNLGIFIFLWLPRAGLALAGHWPCHAALDALASEPTTPGDRKNRNRPRLMW